MIRSITAILGVLLLIGCSLSSRPIEAQRDLPKTMPDAPPLDRDPNNTYGTLDNGLDYIIRPHTNPPGRVSTWLHIKTGSLNETSSQNGLAHFLEHMAFNGSKNFAPGELIPRLAKLGMQFGADSNAHTTYHETVYKLAMPDTKTETVELALTILGDYANGMLLVDEEIEKERQIILNEKGTRKGAQMRLQEKFFQNVFAKTRFAEHNVIGTDEVISTAPRREFLDYYDTWYRPENMTIIVVGDIDSKDIETRIKSHFSADKFTARSKARPARGTGVKPIDKPRAFVFSDPELPISQIRMMRIAEDRGPIDTLPKFRQNEVENLGTAILNLRLQERVQRGEAAFLGGSVSVSGFFGEALMPSADVGGMPANWKTMLEQLVEEIHRGVEHGFLDSELELVKTRMISGAEAAVERAATQDSRVIVNTIASAVGLDFPLMSPQQNLDRLKEVLPTINADQVAAMFRDNFSTKAYTYMVYMPEKGDTLPTADDVLATATAAWANATTPLKKAEAAGPLLTKMPTPGTVKSQTKKPFDVTTIELSNGALVHHRYMDYKKDQATITITVPAGSLEEDASTRGLAQTANLVGATSRLSSTQIRDLMADKKVGTGSGFGLDTFTIQVAGSPSDLEAGMQLAYAQLTDGKIEKSAFDNWKTSAKQQIEAGKTNSQVQAAEALAKSFLGGDLRFTPLDEAGIDALKVEDAERWKKRVFGRALEVAVVGDISLEDTLPLVTRYIGSLPRCEGPFTVLDPLRKIDRPDGPYVERVEFESVTPQAMVQAGYVGCDTEAKDDRRRLNFVRSILQERMTKQLREEEKLVYSIGIAHQPGEGVPGTGLFVAMSPAEPQNADKLATRIIEMMDEFAKSGPTEEEMTVARKQIATQVEEAVRQPAFWQRQLSTLTYRNRDLNDVKGLAEYYEATTVEQVHSVAKKYFVPEKQIRVVAMPTAVVD